MKPIKNDLNPAAVMYRRFLLISLLLLLATVHAREASVHGATAFGITVSELDRALKFYTQVLPTKELSQREVHGADYERQYGVFGMRARIARLQLGEEYIELIEYLAPQGPPIPVDSRSNNEWFQHIAIIVRDMDEAYKHLRKHNVKHASTGPQTLPDWNPNAGGIKAFYFNDPDGHHLELLQFPQGKGDPRWHQAISVIFHTILLAFCPSSVSRQQLHSTAMRLLSLLEDERKFGAIWYESLRQSPKPGNDLFLGIDHTAIVVNDTEQALRFCRGGLGLKVQGHSENYGIEQERPNNVFGARLRITQLKGRQGPAVEFLDHLAPSNGRPMPVDTATNDSWHWQTVVQVDNPAVLLDAVRAAGGRLVSPGSVAMEQAPFQAGMLVRGAERACLVVD